VPSSVWCAELSLIVHGPSWEANSHSASQEIPCLLWNPKIHCHVHRSTSLVRISQMNPVRAFPPHFPKILSNIILPSNPRSSKWSLPLRFSNQNFVRIFHFSLACSIFCPSHPDLITLIIFGEKYKLWSSSGMPSKSFKMSHSVSLQWNSL